MKSSINDQYNVYVPKEEQNSTTQLKHVTQTIYPLDSKFKRQRELSRADAFTRWWVSVTQALNSTVRSSKKYLNSVKNQTTPWFKLV